MCGGGWRGIGRGVVLEEGGGIACRRGEGLCVEGEGRRKREDEKEKGRDSVGARRRDCVEEGGRPSLILREDRWQQEWG